MILEFLDDFRKLTPSQDKWLYNKNSSTVSKQVYLGVEADEKEWTEISQEEKEAMEVAQSGEVPAETILKAKAYDIITGGAQ